MLASEAAQAEDKTKVFSQERQFCHSRGTTTQPRFETTKHNTKCCKISFLKDAVETLIFKYCRLLSMAYLMGSHYLVVGICGQIKSLLIEGSNPVKYSCTPQERSKPNGRLSFAPLLQQASPDCGKPGHAHSYGGGWKRNTSSTASVSGGNGNKSLPVLVRDDLRGWPDSPRLRCRRCRHIRVRVGCQGRSHNGHGRLS